MNKTLSKNGAIRQEELRPGCLCCWCRRWQVLALLGVQKGSTAAAWVWMPSGCKDATGLTAQAQTA